MKNKNITKLLKFCVHLVFETSSFVKKIVFLLILLYNFSKSTITILTKFCSNVVLKDLNISYYRHISKLARELSV